MSQETCCGPPIKPLLNGYGSKAPHLPDRIPPSHSRPPPPPPRPARPLFTRQARLPSDTESPLASPGPSSASGGGPAVGTQALDDVLSEFNSQSQASLNHQQRPSHDPHHVIIGRGPEDHTVPFSRPPTATISSRYSLSKSYSFTNGGDSGGSLGRAPLGLKPVPTPRLTRIQAHIIPEGVHLPPLPPARVESLARHDSDNSNSSRDASAHNVIRRPQATNSTDKRQSVRMSLSEFDTLLAGLETQISELERWDVETGRDGSVSMSFKGPLNRVRLSGKARISSTGTEEEPEDEHEEEEAASCKSHSSTAALVSSSLSGNGVVMRRRGSQQETSDEVDRAPFEKESNSVAGGDLSNGEKSFRNGLMAHELSGSKGSTLSGGRGEATQRNDLMDEKTEPAIGHDDLVSSGKTTHDLTTHHRHVSEMHSMDSSLCSALSSSTTDNASQSRSPLKSSASQDTGHEANGEPRPAFSSEDIHPSLDLIIGRGRLSFYENNDDTLVELLTAGQIEKMIDRCSSAETSSIVSKTPKLLRRAASFRRSKSRPEGEMTSASSILSRAASPILGGRKSGLALLRGSPARSISVSSETSTDQDGERDTYSTCSAMSGTLNGSSAAGPKDDWPVGPIFGCNIELIPSQNGGLTLPPFIESAMGHLASPEHAATMGLFRKSGVKSRILLMRGLIEPSSVATLGKRVSGDLHRLPVTSVEQLTASDELITLHDLADVVKSWLRELKPKPLIPAELVKAFTDLVGKRPIPPGAVGNMTGKKFSSSEVIKPKHLIAHQLRLYRILFRLLSDNHRTLLHVVLRFFALIATYSAQNQMTLSNLAICLTPSLCECPTEKDLDAAQRCLEYFIENVEEIFSISLVDDLAAKPTASNHSSSSIWTASLRRSNSSTAQNQSQTGGSDSVVSNMASLAKLPRHSASTLVCGSPIDILSRILYGREVFDPTVVGWSIHESGPLVFSGLHSNGVHSCRSAAAILNGNCVANGDARKMFSSLPRAAASFVQQHSLDYRYQTLNNNNLKSAKGESGSSSGFSENGPNGCNPLQSRSDVASIKFCSSIFLPRKTILLNRKWLISQDGCRVELRETGELYESKWDIKFFGEGKSVVRHEVAADLRGYSFKWYTTTFPVVHEFQLHRLRESFTLEALYASSSASGPLSPPPPVPHTHETNGDTCSSASHSSPSSASPLVVDDLALNRMRETNV